MLSVAGGVSMIKPTDQPVLELSADALSEGGGDILDEIMNQLDIKSTKKREKLKKILRKEIDKIKKENKVATPIDLENQRLRREVDERGNEFGIDTTQTARKVFLDIVKQLESIIESRGKEIEYNENYITQLEKFLKGKELDLQGAKKLNEADRIALEGYVSASKDKQDRIKQLERVVVQKESEIKVLRETKHLQPTKPKVVVTSQPKPKVKVVEEPKPNWVGVGCMSALLVAILSFFGWLGLRKVKNPPQKPKRKVVADPITTQKRVKKAILKQVKVYNDIQNDEKAIVEFAKEEKNE